MSGPEKYGLLTTTVATRDDAVKIADVLLSEKLAACVQLMPIQSLYSWKGEIRNEAEILLLIKTRAALIREVQSTIAGLHSYEVPEFLVLSVSGGSEPYLDWLDASLR